MTYTIQHIDKNDHHLISQWNDLVKSKALPPQSCYIWKEHLEDVFKINAFALLVTDERGNAVGFSLIYFSNGDETLYSCRYGFHAETDEISSLLQKEMHKICQKNHLRKTVITSGSSQVNLSGYKEERDSFYLPVKYESEEELWLSIPKKTKNMIRKAEKSGFTVTTNWKYLEQFYAIYTDRFLVKELNLKPYSHFSSMKKRFTDDIVFIGVLQDNNLVAGMIFISAGKTVSYVYNASIVNALNNGTNNLLMWEAMKIFRKKGAHYIDLSESKIDSPVYKFKSRTSKDVEARKTHYYDILSGDDLAKSPIRWNVFTRYKIYGILHRLMPIMTTTLKKRYLSYAGKRGRVI